MSNSSGPGGGRGGGHGAAVVPALQVALVAPTPHRGSRRADSPGPRSRAGSPGRHRTPSVRQHHPRRLASLSHTRRALRGRARRPSAGSRRCRRSPRTTGRQRWSAVGSRTVPSRVVLPGRAIEKVPGTEAARARRRGQSRTVAVRSGTAAEGAPRPRAGCRHGGTFVPVRPGTPGLPGRAPRRSTLRVWTARTGKGRRPRPAARLQLIAHPGRERRLCLPPLRGSPPQHGRVDRQRIGSWRASGPRVMSCP